MHALNKRNWSGFSRLDFKWFLCCCRLCLSVSVSASACALCLWHTKKIEPMPKQSLQLADQITCGCDRRPSSLTFNISVINLEFLQVGSASEFKFYSDFVGFWIHPPAAWWFWFQLVHDGRLVCQWIMQCASVEIFNLNNLITKISVCYLNIPLIFGAICIALTNLIWCSLARLLQSNNSSTKGITLSSDSPQKLSLFGAQGWQKLRWWVTARSGENQIWWGWVFPAAQAEQLLEKNRL